MSDEHRLGPLAIKSILCQQRQHSALVRNFVKHCLKEKPFQYRLGTIMQLLQFFLFCFVYLCLLIVFRSESWRCRFDSLLFDSYRLYVSPIEVESALLTHPCVLEAAVIGSEDEHGLVKPVACIVLKDRAQASAALAEQLKQHVKSLLSPHKYPRRVEFLAELPKTATGKIQRFKLREAYGHVSSASAKSSC